MIDRALQKEFPERAEWWAVLETVARVTSKKNDTKEDKSFQLHDVFNNENRAEDMPTLIDRKDNVFIISNPKSKYPMLQLDQRLISDLVVVIVSMTCGGIAFACAGQPVITGYLLAGSVIGPGAVNVKRGLMLSIDVETVAQFGVIFLLFALGLEFSTTKLCGGKPSEGVFVGAFLSMSSTAVVLKFLMEKNCINSLHGQASYSRHTDSSGSLVIIIVFWLYLAQDCAVGLLFALLPVLGGTSGVFQGTNELYQLAAVAFCLLVAWCSDKLGLSLELGSFAAGVMISTTDLAQHTLEQIEPIRNFFAALFLASIGMLIDIHFLWNHVDILLASVILVIIIKTIVLTAVVKGFGYTNKTSLLVGMSLAQIGEFAFVLLSRASNLHLVQGKLYLLLLGTTALSLVTTPLLFKLIPAVIHLGVLLRWFSPDTSLNEVISFDQTSAKASVTLDGPKGPHAS
ncbi:hypothetical protein J5N97_025860 [Dioscorea zingiberensis]|uniref:Cation/H+ exchanger transmembrane domain-containing protein n=1 Tax=Dioscorea zingiberensis TaxID=325984 RepID=A0A9D5C254_9LILI|nr:hypothetical protein J5N97_025860 [Dioscorea zingiberensis]